MVRVMKFTPMPCYKATHTQTNSFFSVFLRNLYLDIGNPTWNLTHWTLENELPIETNRLQAQMYLKSTASLRSYILIHERQSSLKYGPAQKILMVTKLPTNHLTQTITRPRLSQSTVLFMTLSLSPTSYVLNHSEL